TLMQRVPAAHLAGRRIRFSAEVRSQDLDGWAGLWMRSDDEDGRSMTFDNMHDRPIKNIESWTRFVLEMDLPAAARWLNFGFLLVGPGELGARAAQLVALQGDKPGSPLDRDPRPRSAAA